MRIEVQAASCWIGGGYSTGGGGNSVEQRKVEKNRLNIWMEILIT